MITNRNETRPIYVNGIQIGGNNKVVIQSMLTTKTNEVEKCLEQIKQLEIAGCQIVRLALPQLSDVVYLKQIIQHSPLPIVADIHFDYKIALGAIEAGVHKIRINPGNIGKKENIIKVVNACKQANIPIRIGINAGSLEKKYLDKYSYPCSEALVESALEHCKILEELDFYDICVSLKSSDWKMAYDAYKEFSKKRNYPLHIGITEAGTKLTGAIKSAIGVSKILDLGIGSTLRVSLSTSPLDEIVVAKEILKNNDLYEAPTLISCPTCGRIEIDLLGIINEIETWLWQFKYPIKVTILGCAVNGPGEAREAHIGLAGGKKEGIIYKFGKFYKKVPENIMIQTLKEEIITMIENDELKLEK